MAAPYYVDYDNGNDDTGDGSISTPWKTAQKAATALAAGETVYGTGTEIINTAIVPANGGSVAAGYIKYIACNASWTPTIGGWKWKWANGDGTQPTNIFKPAAAKDLIWFGGIEMYGASSHGIATPSAYCNGWRMCDCIIRNNGGDGINGNGSYMAGIQLLRCKIYSNTAYGINAVPQAFIDGCEIYLNGSGGAQGYSTGNYDGCVFIRSIFRDNSVFGINIWAGIISDCVIDNNVIGVRYNGATLTHATINRVTNSSITNNSTAGILCTAGANIMTEDRNVFYSNGTNRVTGTGALLVSGGNSVDTATNPYVDQPNKNYTRTGTSIRFESILLPNGLQSMSVTAGLTQVPDFPAVANVRTNDTVDGVTGTWEGLYSAAEEAERNKFAAGTSEADLLLGKSIKLLNVDYDGELVQSTGGGARKKDPFKNY